MNGAVIARLLLWTVLWCVLMFLAVSVALLGDCPEYIHSDWPNYLCSERKDLARHVIFIGGPLIWLIVSTLVFRRRPKGA